MAKKRILLHFITLWHPEKWLDTAASQLSTFPRVIRGRAELEKRRIEAAKEKSVQIVVDRFHERRITNMGKPVNRFRKTWIKTDYLISCLNDLDPRLIHTKGDGKQSQYRLEYRYDWAEQPDILEQNTKQMIINSIDKAKRISIRQIWENPIEGRFGLLPLPVPENSVKQLGNLVIGPYSDKECFRHANIKIQKDDNAWWLNY